MSKEVKNTLQGDESNSNAVEQWRIKRMIQQLSEAKGNGGTSLISLACPPNSQVSLMTKTLGDE